MGCVSSAGVRLITRAAFMLLVIVVTAVARVLVGRGRQREEIMMVGTLGGLASGVFLAYLISLGIKTDVSAICAFFGIVFGWGVAWRFARHFPRGVH
jgi:hypothetical protein